MMKRIALPCMILFLAFPSEMFAQENINKNIFRELVEELPAPNQFRTASGRPGPAYFQQQVDYVMDIKLDEIKKTVSGTETVTYRNNSPETLTYLWMQLDQNIYEPGSYGSKIATSAMNAQEPVSTITLDPHQETAAVDTSNNR